MKDLTRYDLIAGDIQPYEDGDYVTYRDYMLLSEEKKQRDTINLRIKQNLSIQITESLEKLREYLSNENQPTHHIYPYQACLCGESTREEIINEIASQIGRGTFYQDAERIYDLFIKPKHEV